MGDIIYSTMHSVMSLAGYIFALVITVVCLTFMATLIYMIVVAPLYLIHTIYTEWRRNRH